MHNFIYFNNLYSSDDYMDIDLDRTHNSQYSADLIELSKYTYFEVEGVLCRSFATLRTSRNIPKSLHFTFEIVESINDSIRKDAKDYFNRHDTLYYPYHLLGYSLDSRDVMKLSDAQRISIYNEYKEKFSKEIINEMQSVEIYFQKRRENARKSLDREIERYTKELQEIEDEEKSFKKWKTKQ